MRRNALLSVVMFALLLAPPAFAAPERDRALDILDSRTSSHWGEDNLAWVVHYPEDLVDPWVKSYAEKRKLTAEQTERYRKAFTDELKTGAATAVMLSVHSFGPSPLSLSPLATNVSLIDTSGKRVQPIVYEKKLDSPIRGLIQGFVFFPLQKDGDFRIAVKGLVPDRETVFAFDGSPGAAIATRPATRVNTAGRPQSGSVGEPEDVVVRIPTVKPPTAPAQPKPPVVSRDEKQEEPEFSLEGETYPPTAPPPSDSPEPQADTGPDGQGEQSGGDGQTTSQETPREQPALGLSPKLTLDIFLKAWIRGDTDQMYDLLSEESRARISKELFEKDALGAGGFRQGLRDGYKITWEGDGAKVTVSQKLLLLRTLNSRRFAFVEENGSARIAW